MVLRVEPVVACLEEVLSESAAEGISREETKVLLTAADGHVYNQRLARDFTELKHVVILCGHYKGFDERVVSFVDMKVCVGDYVLSGGELPALILVDSIARLLEGVVSDFESVATDSHWEGLLGAPCWTRPEDFRGLGVPEVLKTGHHRNIQDFRFCEAVKRTVAVRPELLKKRGLSGQECRILRKAGLNQLALRHSSEEPAPKKQGGRKAEEE